MSRTELAVFAVLCWAAAVLAGQHHEPRLVSSYTRENCSATTYCPDGYHCCTATTCCPYGYYCCGGGYYCCSSTGGNQLTKLPAVSSTQIKH